MEKWKQEEKYERLRSTQNFNEPKENKMFDVRRKNRMSIEPAGSLGNFQSDIITEEGFRPTQPLIEEQIQKKRQEQVDQ